MKKLGVPVVIDGDNLPSPVGIGLTDLPNIGGASGPPGPPGSGTTELEKKGLKIFVENLKRSGHSVWIACKFLKKFNKEA